MSMLNTVVMTRMNRRSWVSVFIIFLFFAFPFVFWFWLKHFHSRKQRAETETNEVQRSDPIRRDTLP